MGENLIIKKQMNSIKIINPSLRNGIKFLVLFVIILVELEIVLRLGGFLYMVLYSTSYDKNADFVILSIGESTTFGMGVEPEQTYSKKLERMLNNNLGNISFTVINKGVGAQVSTSVVRNIDNQMVKYEPNLVISLLGINDFSDRLSKIKSIKNGLLEPLKHLRIYKLGSLMIDYFRAGTTIVEGGAMRFYSPTGSNFSVKETYMKQLEYNYDEIITKVRNNYHSDIVLITYISCGTYPINGFIRQTARDHNAPYVYNKVHCGNSELFSEDNWHPNEQGHELIAKNLYNVLISENLVPVNQK